jgi:hypothetical protein
MSQKTVYVCRESFGPYQRGKVYDDVPEKFKNTPVFVKAKHEVGEKDAAPSLEGKE